MINHEALVRTANELGPLPQSVSRLTSLFADPDYEIRDVVSTIELDASLAGKLLRLANSAVYAGKPVSSIGEAVMRLGSGTVRSLAVAANAKPKSDVDLTHFELTPESYWYHCVAVLSFAEELSATDKGRFGDDFSTAAVLHDFGKLVLAEHITSTQHELMQQEAPELPAAEKEMRVLSVSHAEVSAVVAQGWNLNEDLVRAVQYHHSPSPYAKPLCHGLNLANQLAWRLESRDVDYERESAARATSLEALELEEDSLDLIFEKGKERLTVTLEVFQ